jgi:hypothetical protein
MARTAVPTGIARAAATGRATATRTAASGRAAASATPDASADVIVTIDRGTAWKTSVYQCGCTYIQETLEGVADPLNPASYSTAEAQAKALLQGITHVANQHVCNFGAASNLVPTSGDITTPASWNWTSLDRRLKLMYATGATPMLTLGLVPSWMRPGGSSATDDPWASSEDVADGTATTDHENTMVEMFKQVALRYKPNSAWWTALGISNYGVTRFQFWNEMKGLFQSSSRTYTPDPNDPRGAPQNTTVTNRMNYVKYVRAFNKVIDAFDGVFGNRAAYTLYGPYPVVEGSGGLSTLGIPNPAIAAYVNSDPWSVRNQAAIEYFFAFAKKVDGICYDYRLMDGEDNGEPAGENRWLRYPPHQRIRLAKWYGDVPIATRSFARTNHWSGTSMSTTIPIIQSEEYVIKYEAEGLGNADWMAWAACATASMIYHLIRGDVALGLRWGPEQGAGKLVRMDWFNKTSDPTVAKTPIYDIYKLMRDAFGAGTVLATTTSSDAGVEVLANPTQTVLINTHPSARTISVNGTRVRVEGYGVRLLTI